MGHTPVLKVIALPAEMGELVGDEVELLADDVERLDEAGGGVCGDAAWAWSVLGRGGLGRDDSVYVAHRASRRCQQRDGRTGEAR